MRYPTTIDLRRLYREQAVSGKYRRLYEYLCERPEAEWETSFGEIEAIVGFKLPTAARENRLWWVDSGHDHVRAWLAAGWKTAEVKLDKGEVRFWREGIYAPDGQSVSSANAVDALNELQTVLAQRGVDLAGWAQELRSERQATRL